MDKITTHNKSDNSKGIWVTQYRIILPAIFAVSFIIFASILQYYFDNLPREKIVTTNPTSVIMKLNLTDKLIKKVKVTFPEEPANVTYRLEGPSLNTLIDINEEKQNEKDRALYLITKSFPRNFSNQTYEGFINMSYYFASNNNTGNIDYEKKSIDLTLTINNPHMDLEPTTNITNR